ncbi:GTPase HflX [Numidum massiliense]|uniref:GTPase HflX n=1 Tax=Numidum massiliense TaxID=1522315 RepID=UPI0006D530F8|nr:GTPase HflX [Numidum massiliense]
MTHSETQRALLVALETYGDGGGWTASESLDELENLAGTAGATVVGREIQRRPHRDAVTYIGKGKAIELGSLQQALGFDLIIFDGELSPLQQRNLERLTGCPVIDRTTVILDIFAQRARSNEAKLQVELAQLQYRLPRIVGKGTELSRLGGGIGTRGPGETKLEVDRRRIRDRIAAVKRELAEVTAHRTMLRAKRREGSLPVVALTGYTNAGKSTLHRVLAGSSVLVEDRLFATLDATARKVEPEDGEPYVLIDTVGFINQLPTFLVAAFRSTLEEVKAADLLLHVVDATHPKRHEQMQTVQEVLAELGAGDKPTIVVYNKSEDGLRQASPDAGEGVASGEAAPEDGKELSIAVSARHHLNLDQLQRTIQQVLARRRETVACTIPYADASWVPWLYAHGHVLEEAHRVDGIYVRAELEKGLAKQLHAHLTAKGQQREGDR